MPRLSTKHEYRQLQNHVFLAYIRFRFQDARFHRFFLPFFYGIVKLLAIYKPNIKESISKRKNLWERLEKQISKRDWQKPLLWFHVASAGEFLQAKPVIERCILRGAECAC